MTATMPALVTTRVMTLSNSDRASIWYQSVVEDRLGIQISLVSRWRDFVKILTLILGGLAKPGEVFHGKSAPLRPP
jgi:hypothetical protein